MEGGEFFAIGYKYYGQLCTGETKERHAPVRIQGSVRAVAAGGYHSLFLTEDGDLFAMGFNYDGQLCKGDATQRVHAHFQDKKPHLLAHRR